MKIIEAHLPQIDTPLRLGCLASGNASSFRRIVAAIENNELNAEAVVLISNKPDSPALQFAREHNIPAFSMSKATEGSAEAVDQKIRDEFVALGVNLFILSGYLPVVGPHVLAACTGLNVHPSLLPRHGGKHMHGNNVHRAVLDAGEKGTGASIHLVDAELDHGLIIAQEEIPVEPGDTVETLGSRVRAIEPELFVATLQAIARRRKS